MKRHTSAIIKLFSLFVLLAISLPLTAHTLLHSKYLDRENHEVNAELIVEDPFRTDVVGNPPSYVVSRRVMPTLVYGREDRSDIAGTVWSYRVSYTLFDEAAGEEIFSDQLMIRHRDDDGIYEDIHNYFSPSGLVKITITNIEASADDFATVITDPTQIAELVPDDIRLELRLEVTRHDRVSTLTNANLEADYVAANHDMEVRWDFVEGAEYYELEWAYIDEYNLNYNNYSLPQDEEEIFKNATRVEVYGQYYDVSVTYPDGHLYYRVRPMGVFIEDVDFNYTHIEFGQWRAEGPVLVEGFQEDFNWQTTTTFAEEGKYKKVINYFDDGLRSRQVQTNLSTEKITMVGTSHYDTEGRPTVNVLPVPSVGDNKLFYKPRFNRSVIDGQTYNRKHFDKGGENLCENNLPDPLSSSLNAEGLGGAAYYYSPDYGNDSSNPSLYKEFLPDAEGYPITQVKYLNDGTGRLAIQSGVGEFYQLGNGRETRYFYDDASEMQLKRLFGDNVGDAKYYKRNIVMDANGQMRVHYLDGVDRVVVTALVGVVPGNLNALESASTSEVTVVEDLMENNDVDEENGISSLVSMVMNEQIGQTADFAYTFTGVNNDVDVEGASICVSCIYELSIDVYSPCGEKVAVVLEGDDNNDGKVTIGNYAFCDQVLETRTYEFSVLMQEVGLYRVEKILRVIQPDAGTIQNIIEESNLFPTVEDINVPINYLECANNCNDYCTLTLGAGATQAQIDECIANCTQDGEAIIGQGITQSCDYLLAQMKSQVSPEGCLFGQQWWNVQDLTNIDLTLENGDVVTADQVTNLLTDADAWQDSWEDALVVAHPEYCHYVLCTGTDASRQFDYDLARSEETWIDYVWQDVQNLLMNDPMFSSGQGFYPGHDANTDLTAGQKADIKDAIEAVVPGSVNTNSPSDIASKLRNLLEDRLEDFGQCSSGGATLNIIDYINDCIAQGDVFLSQSERWHHFVALYQGEKLKLQNELREEWCAYGSGACAITEDNELYDVPAPEDGDTETAINDYINSLNNGAGIADVCGTVCVIRAEEWLNLLLLDCPNITEAEQNTIRTTFINHCEANCDGDNPLGYPLEGEGFDNLNLPTTNCGNIGDLLDDISVISTTVYEEYCRVNGCLSETLAALADAVSGGPAPCNATVTTCWGEMILTDGTLITTDSPQACCNTFNIWTTGEGSQPASLCDYTDIGDIYIENNQFLFDATNFSNQRVTLRIFCGGIDYNLDSGSPQEPCEECYLIPITITQPEECEGSLVTENMVIEEFILNEIINTIITEVVQAVDCDDFTETFKVSYPTREHHYTLYYYDQAGNLVQTVPPAGVNPVPTSAFSSEGVWDGTNPVHDQQTRYRYNTLGQVVWQYSPDGGQLEFKYDYAQRLRVSQNGRQRINTTDDDPNNDVEEKLSYTKYDAEGRIIEVGELRKPSGTITFNNIDEAQLNDPGFPTSNEGELWDVTETEYNTAINGNGFIQDNTRSRVSRTKRYNNQKTNFTDPVIETRYSYNEHGNIKSIWHNIDALQGRIQRIDYDFDVLSGRTKQVSYQAGKVDQFYHRYEYDADNRLTNVYTSDDGGAWDRDACYQYYMHGPLARVEIGNDKVQGLDYYHTLQGWIKGVNMPGDKGYEIDPGRDGYINEHGLIGRDAMAFGLGYYEGDYKAVGSGVNLEALTIDTWNSFDNTPVALDGVKGLFNSDISWMLTDIPSLDETEFSNEGLIGVTYQYDQLHRITQSRTYNNTPGSNNNVSWSYDGDFDTDYTYKINGNLMNLQRNTLDGGQVRQMDNLTYNYTDTQRPNKLTSVTEGLVDVITDDPSVTNQPSDNYLYDDIGNLIRNEQDDVDIEWDVYGKVKRITFNSYSEASPYTSIDYTYDAAGNRLSKYINHAAPDLSYSVHYVRGAGGNILSIYNKNTTFTGTTIVQKEIPLYGSSRLGQQKFLGNERVVPDPNDPVASNVYLLEQRIRGQKNYESSNHIGNVLTVISDKKIGFEIDDPIYLDDLAEYYEAAIVSTSDYYPFGFNMPDRTENSSSYRYGLNGKEKDDDGEWGSQKHYDYGARIYNPGIANWLSVDPKADKFTDQSPYNYVINNPVNLIDLDGRDTIKFITVSYTFPGAGGLSGYNQQRLYGSSSVVVIEAPGEDKFFKEVYSTHEDGQGGTKESKYVKEFFPLRSGYKSGLTRTEAVFDPTTIFGNGIFGRYDEDFVTLAKWAPDGLVDYLESKRGAGYSSLAITKADYAFYENVKFAAETLTMIYGGYKAIVPSKNLAKVDLMGGPKGTSGYINYDKVASAGISDDVANFSNHFGKGSVGEVVVNNPQATFLEHVSQSVAPGGTVTVRGNMSNKFFKKVYKGTANGMDDFTVVKRTEDVANKGYKRTDGASIQGQLNEVVLKKN